MTDTRRVDVTFSDLAKVCRMDYIFMKQGTTLYKIKEPENEEVQHLLHYQETSKYGTSGGLRMFLLTFLSIATNMEF